MDAKSEISLQLAARLVEEIERAVGFELDAPIMQQLLPEENNPWLQRLNAARHPRDVTYEAMVVRAERGLEYIDLDGAQEGAFWDNVPVTQFLNDVLQLIRQDRWAGGDGIVPVSSGSLP
ncbi:MAG: hypothetical protein GVY18_11900 [Bacteroidetes bacterium]|jgi:hypothetical protein|nr:hypothetical protein [Bacteroidota bacterium]